jgi:hypothetical protein
MKFAFPDEGAFKRFGKPLQKYCPSLYRDGNVVICGKVKNSMTINLFSAACHHAAFAPSSSHLFSQTRVGDDRRIWITDGDPKGAHVVLVDDLVRATSPRLPPALLALA